MFMTKGDYDEPPLPQMDRFILENRLFTISEVCGKFQEVSLSIVHEIVTQHLEYQKFCAWLVPRMLMDDYKAGRMDTALVF